LYLNSVKNKIKLKKENIKVKYFKTKPEDNINNNLFIAPPPKFDGIKL
tara:strand:+ start:1252 stop:1395 length:144 start_codon:yes stop_codon:yes gene_type:complete